MTQITSRWRRATAVAIGSLAILSGCGTSPQEMAAREAEQRRIAQQEAQRRSERIAALEASAESRRKSGETPPDLLGTDPGHEVMRCQGLSPVPFTIDAPLPALGTIICGNSEAGRKVVAHRNWYCGASASDCVLAKWENGHPTLSRGFGETMQLNFRIPVSNGIASVSLSPFDL
ncbi:MAG: hypothetical protein MUC37_13960 [Hyphomicrobium sp.]|jgi:hypothetical protein|nr:hypothetical protein [Hyphomicrobium sp.]